jgi:hypothetical protein
MARNGPSFESAAKTQTDGFYKTTASEGTFAAFGQSKSRIRPDTSATFTLKDCRPYL